MSSAAAVIGAIRVNSQSLLPCKFEIDYSFQTNLQAVSSRFFFKQLPCKFEIDYSFQTNLQAVSDKSSSEGP